jgi:ABC-2 type transport system permease protein
MEFIVPGLVMMAVISSSFNNVVSSFFGSRFQKNLDEILVSPTPNWVIITGFAAGGVLRGLLVGLIVFGISLGFNPTINVDNIFVILFFIIATAVLFSLGGLTNGIFAKKFDDVAIFGTFILTPLTYLGGVFYSLDQLPPFWRTLSAINPIVYMVDGFRAGFSGQSEFGVLLDAVLVVTAICIVAGLNWFLLRRGVGIKQ